MIESNLGVLDVIMIAVVGFLAVFVGYLYSSFALFTIATKTRHKKDRWQAFVPLINLKLMVKIAKVPIWSFWTVISLIFLNTILSVISLEGIIVPGFISALISIALIGFTVWWWWHICEKMHYPNWYGILMAVPIVNILTLGIIAWVDKK